MGTGAYIKENPQSTDTDQPMSVSGRAGDSPTA